jgi:type II secretory pathway component PulJ
MLYQRRISAFTLQETLIALVLMVIVIGLASTAVSLIGKNTQIVTKNEMRYRGLEQIEFALNLDFSRFNNMKVIDTSLVMSNPIEELVYTWTNNNEKWCFLRASDTLLSGQFQPSFYHHGKPVSSGAVDAIELKLENEEFIFVYKPLDFLVSNVQNEL